MLSASLEDAIIYEIKLNSSSFSIHNEEDVISFDYLVVPETMLNDCLVLMITKFLCSTYRKTNQIPGCRGWHSDSSETKWLGCSTGNLGCVIDIVFKAPSLSSQSSSLIIQQTHINIFIIQRRWISSYFPLTCTLCKGVTALAGIETGTSEGP